MDPQKNIVQRCRSYTTMCIFNASGSMSCCIAEISSVFQSPQFITTILHLFPPLRPFHTASECIWQILFCDPQARLVRGDILVNPECLQDPWGVLGRWALGRKLKPQLLVWQSFLFSNLWSSLSRFARDLCNLSLVCHVILCNCANLLRAIKSVFSRWGSSPPILFENSLSARLLCALDDIAEDLPLFVRGIRVFFQKQ
jgi:hypothetical protein